MADAGESQSSNPNSSNLVSDPLDAVTGLPLIICPVCRDIRIIARTCINTQNAGRRFFKCPRNREKDPTSCPSYWFQEDYQAMLRPPLRHNQNGSNVAASVHTVAHPGPPVCLDSAISDNVSVLKADVLSLTRSVERMNREEALIRFLLVFIGVLIFLVSAVVVLVAVVLYAALG